MTEDVKIKISSDFDKKGFDALKNSLSSTNKELTSTNKSLDAFGIGLNALASGAITAFVVKAANMGAELSVLRSNFIGSSKDIELFRKATAGTVDDGSLIKLSNYASDLGVNLEDQAKLFSLAEDAADKYGGTVESNFERVINASDGSAKGLRSVGISTKDFGEEVEKLTGKMGLKLDAMTADEQQNIRLQAIYNLTGTTLETVNNKTQDSKDKMDSLQVTVMNATASFGEGLVGSLNSTVETLGQLSSVTETAGIKLFTFNEIAASIGSAIGDLSPLISVFRLVSSEVQTATDKIKQFFQSASLSTPTYQFQSGNEDTIQFDKYGNPITPKGILAENTNYTGGKNLGYNPQSMNGGKGGDVAKEIIEKTQQELYIEMLRYIRGSTSARIESPYIPLLNQMNLKDGQGYAQRQTPNLAPDSRNTLEDIQTGYSLIGQSMSLLNIGTDTFVGKLMAVFNFANSALNIGSSIVSFITKIIPGLGSMPSLSGGSMSLDTNRMINQSVNMSSSPVNIYMSSNVNQKYFKAQIENYNNMKQYTKL